MEKNSGCPGSICLALKGVPFSKQSFRIHAFVPMGGDKCVIVHKYQARKVVEGEKALRTQIIAQLPSGFKPFTNAVVVWQLEFVFTLPKSAKKHLVSLVDSGVVVYKTSTPDLTDNLMKGLFDAMKGLVFIDDSQVANIQRVRKIYGPEPGINLEIEEMMADEY